MSDHLRQIMLRIFAAVLLSVIGSHAAIPAKAVEQQRGSAFSVATLDVAVLGNLRQAANAAAPLPAPPAPPVAGAASFILPIVADAPGTRRPLPWAQAPPLKPVGTRPSQPRAPPSTRA
ncbi:hypothetical protein [Porphyrobacter sp. GA68]|uniref:hypothetical protein n=1 Tax=Porphyrobacter sp. GA68 TaxID=2883480 RepID=UPI001D194D20|nr:hypothetical protein [Porphyrobacter sp. GA68]